MLITRGFGETAEGLVTGFEIAVAMDESPAVSLDIEDQIEVSLDLEEM
mgnify:CR=1 FL=1